MMAKRSRFDFCVPALKSVGGMRHSITDECAELLGRTMRLQLTMRVWRGIMTGHLSTGLCAAAFLSIAIVALAGGCNHSRSTPEGATAVSDEVSQVSQALIGKRITIRGKFSLQSKITVASVWLDSHQAVYLRHKGEWGPPYSAMEGKLVTATGVLRFYHDPDAKPTDLAVARLPDHFYFDEETTQVRLIGH
jgi:hypothetical protein